MDSDVRTTGFRPQRHLRTSLRGFRSVAARSLGIGLLSLSAASGALATVEPGCDLESSYGPFDYRTASQKDRDLVEKFHFTRDVEMLRHGSTGGSIPGPDINYTLTVFPNHPRALKSMMELGIRDKTPRPQGVRFTVECYFDRALRFTPDDANVKVLYAIFLKNAGRKADALQMLSSAAEQAGETANIHYNLGLLYLDVGQFDQALLHAHAAYRLGFTLPGLRDRLKRAGKWREDTSSDSQSAGRSPADGQSKVPPAASK